MSADTPTLNLLAERAEKFGVPPDLLLRALLDLNNRDTFLLIFKASVDQAEIK